MNSISPLRPCGPSGPGRPVPGSPARPLAPFWPAEKNTKSFWEKLRKLQSSIYETSNYFLSIYTHLLLKWLHELINFSTLVWLLRTAPHFSTRRQRRQKKRSLYFHISPRLKSRLSHCFLDKLAKPEPNMFINIWSNLQETHSSCKKTKIFVIIDSQTHFGFCFLCCWLDCETQTSTCRCHRDIIL